VTLYPTDLQHRFEAIFKGLQQRIAKLETRTAAIDSGWPLAALPAVVDAAYTSGDPKAYLNGATTLTGPYQHLSSYTPAAGDTVLALPVGANRTYVILCKLT
jgi:hypothetical protein